MADSHKWWNGSYTNCIDVSFDLILLQHLQLDKFLDSKGANDIKQKLPPFPPKKAFGNMDDTVSD